MISKKEWFSRSFERFNDNIMLPNIMERLMGTPVRLAEKVSKIEAAKFEQKPQNKWSIKEEIGHLADLEPLWLARVDDILLGKDLRPADLTNKKTHEANHNSKSVKTLLSDFTEQREKLVHKLLSVKEADLNKLSLHPRLKTPMRLIDLAFFVAEHDDHHLAQISFLNNIIKL